MTKEEYLLTVASEECIEISKEIHKSLRFGLEAINPFDTEQKPNKLNIALEFIDLQATIELLKEQNILNIEEVLKYNNYDIVDLLQKKKEKVEKYWNYSNSNKLENLKLSDLDELLETKIPIKNIKPIVLSDLLKSLNINLLENMDSNGWQHYFWCPFNYKGYKLRYYGCWFTGESTLCISED
jgi:hypothetical protein